MSSGYEGGLGDVAIEVLHMLLSYLIQHSQEDFSVSKENLNAFISILRRGIIS